jgi:hypothetical protein
VTVQELLNQLQTCENKEATVILSNSEDGNSYYYFGELESSLSFFDNLGELEVGSFLPRAKECVCLYPGNLEPDDKPNSTRKTKKIN